MIASVLPIPSARRHAVFAGAVPTDTAARRPVVTVMLLAIAFNQRCGPVTAPAVGAATEAFTLERQRTARPDISFVTGHLAPSPVFGAVADLRPATAVVALATTA